MRLIGLKFGLNPLIQSNLYAGICCLFDFFLNPFFVTCKSESVLVDCFHVLVLFSGTVLPLGLKLAQIDGLNMLGLPSLWILV